MKAFRVRRGQEVYFRVDLPKRLFADGKRRSVVGKTKQEALNKAEDQMQGIKELVIPDAGAKTVESFLQEFLAFYRTEGGVAASTWQDYRYQVDANIVPLIGRLRLDELEPRFVDQFLRALRTKGLSNRSVDYALAVLRRALQFAVDWRFIAVNPASSRMRAAKRRKARENPKMQCLNREQAKQFLEAVRGDRCEALYMLALTSGMRQGEILGLQWSILTW